MENRLLFDLHTHTVYSHGKGQIIDNARAAVSRGMNFLGISDHGPGHIGFGMKLEKIPEMRRDIIAAKAEFPGLDIHLGVEANIINKSGNLDVSKEDSKLFDYIIAGYHFGVMGENPLRACLVHGGGWLYSLTGWSTQRAKNFNTEMTVRAIYENNIKIISHPGAKAAFDISEIAKACEDRGTWMEINNRHGCLTVEGIKEAMKYDVKFIIGSDAHVPEHIGNYSEALSRAEAAGLEYSRIVNLIQE